MDTEEQRTIWCGNLSERVTEEILYDLFLQAAPIQRVKIPKDREGRPSAYGFITVKHVESVPYSIDLLNGTSLFDRKINLKTRNTNNNPQHAREQQQHNQRQPQQSNPEEPFFVDPGKLMNLGEQMRISNAVFNSCDNYSGSRHQSAGGNRWERNNAHREEKRAESYPYRYEGNRSGGNNYNRRNNYENNSNTYHNNRNRRRY